MDTFAHNIAMLHIICYLHHPLHIFSGRILLFGCFLQFLVSVVQFLDFAAKMGWMLFIKIVA